MTLLIPSVTIIPAMAAELDPLSQQIDGDQQDAGQLDARQSSDPIPPVTERPEPEDEQSGTETEEPSPEPEVSSSPPPNPSSSPTVTIEPPSKALPPGKFAPHALTSGSLRIGGADRYDTAIALSQRLVPKKNTSTLIFVASGSTYADGLPLGALAAYTGSPLLLTPKNSAPDKILNEIRRLSATNVTVYIAGGNAAVSHYVEEQITAVIGTNGTVERLEGKNRFETSLRIAEKFPAGSTVMLSTGLNYPDALVASASSGKAGGGAPVILTPGFVLGADAAQALRVLSPKQVYLIGGTWSDAETARVRDESGGATVTAVKGEDRYSTAVAVAKKLWGATPSTIIYTTGKNYADAMTSGPAGKAFAAPVLLTTPECRPKSVANTASRQSKVLILGGERALNRDIEKTSCPDLLRNGTYRFDMSWAGQPNGYWCGPATGYMIMQRLGWHKSASGVPLSQANLARYMDTNEEIGTAWARNRMSVGMNDWMGKNVYQQQAAPTTDFFRSKVIRSFTITGRPMAVDTQEWANGPHFNNHPRSTFSHLMAIEGYDPRTDTIMLLDPGAKTLWPYSEKLFSHNLASFTPYLQDFGIYY